MDLSRRELGLAGMAFALSPAEAFAQLPKIGGKYRPRIHYSPAKGFMNDPNGLVFANGEYHLFYQYNPTEAKAGHVHWGHAVSRDLVRWEPLPIAIYESLAGQAFSGSAVVDGDRIVAVYTRASATKQTQEIATSRDGGRTFAEYSGNPVVDRGTDSFRDPKVFWHAPTKEWKMAVVLAREHRVLFYGSTDLIRWRELGSFGPTGILGVDYECPDLVEVPVEGGGAKWVLFVSINPGAPLGGSGTQYFVGEFDGNAFVPDAPVTRFADFGKDFYALQSYANAPDGPLGIAWMSNWQYCNETPTGSWRGVMSLARRFALRRTDAGFLLVQVPVGLDALKAEVVLADGHTKGALEHRVPAGEALEIRATLDLEPGAVATLSLAHGRESVGFGYDADAGQLFVDRGETRGFGHRFFTDKMSAAARPGTRTLDVHAIVDACTFELFAQNGEVVGSALHFFATPPNRLRAQIVGKGEIRDLSIRALRV